MKSDEYKMLLNKELYHPIEKRRNYILNKWREKKWLVGDNILTYEFDRIYELAVNKNSYIDKWDGRVVIIHYIIDKWNCGPTAGILEYHGDTGYYLYTSTRTWFLGSYSHFNEIAYVELHPNPNKIWRKLNYYYWKSKKQNDRFHKKIASWSNGTVRSYNQGIMICSNPAGKIGDCFPSCQCKHLK